MPSLHDVMRFLNNIPRGFSADGRTLGLGLASAMQAQRNAAAERGPRRSTDEAAGPGRDDERVAAR
jgi:hypothetical protein